ncbi:MAG: F0F1 ATP synthase subunit C [Candidatus Tectomicrobia bacterium]|nr:F0F1 ATP synthase subunit C [Candidatus Tectomicrobia bacterium]
MLKRIAFSFFFIVAGVLGVSRFAFAAETAGGGDSMVKAALALASGLAIAIAALAGAMGQGRVAAAAMDGIARNPNAQERMFIPFVLGLVFIESLVIYALVIAFFLQGKI